MKTIYQKSALRLLEASKENRTVQFVISSARKDRHGTVMNMDGWNLDNFNANGIVGYQHDVYGNDMCRAADPDLVIGTGRAWVERAPGKKVLIGEVTFEPADVNPLADKIYKKVLHGTLKATSVGFQPIGGGRLVNDKTGRAKRLNEAPSKVPKGHTFYYDGQELLEFSVVNIPSNPEALKRNLRDQAANALHFLKRELGEGVTYGEIEQMRIVDLIKMLEKKRRAGRLSALPTSAKRSRKQVLYDTRARLAKLRASANMKFY